MGLNSVAKNPSTQTPIYTFTMTFKALTRKRNHTHVTLSDHTEWASFWEKELICIGVTPTADDHVSNPMPQQQN